MKAAQTILALAAAALAACATPDPVPEPEVREAQEVTAIEVHSLPPGCFVELNDEFLGVTPVTIRVPSSSGKWTGNWGQLNVLRASIPRGPGHDQKWWANGDVVPRRVVFRIPGAETWYHANSPQRPVKPTVQVR